MKKQYGFFNAWLSTQKASKMTAEELNNLQEHRLRTLLQYARAHSPYYAEKYAQLPINPSLEALPPVNKRELMERFEDWVTDPAIKLRGLHSFIKDLDNIGRDYLGRYLVCTTSGSTGVPAILLYDDNTLSALDALAVSRAVAHKGVMMKLVKKGGRSAAIYANGGHYLGIASVRRKQIKNPLKAKQFKVLSVLSPIEEIVEALNGFQPALLGGYPTALELLIPQQLAGKLCIHPVLINTGGEQLKKELADQLSSVFGCPVQSGYSCSEGGMIAFECKEGHLHINADWVIVEPVDHNGSSVPRGTLSDKMLLTNLTNFVQPIIRYEVTDRVRILKDPCPCGSILPVIEVEGRSDDIVVLEGSDGMVSIPPLALYVVLKEAPGVVRFQLLQFANNVLELRLETSGDSKLAKDEAIKRLEVFLRQKGVKARITMSTEPPAPDPSGKFRHFLKHV